jgi:hypothetical protein
MHGPTCIFWAKLTPLSLKRVDDLISRLTLEEKPFLLIARESPLGNIQGC